MKAAGKALLVFGSRTLDDGRIDALIGERVTAGGYRYLITALDPRGVCERAKHYAKTCRLGIVLVQVGLDEKRARGMHEARSVAALEMADAMLAIWDGKSKGTAGEIKLARKMGVPTEVVILNPVPAGAADPDEIIRRAQEEGLVP